MEFKETLKESPPSTMGGGHEAASKARSRSRPHFGWDTKHLWYIQASEVIS